MLVDSYYFFFLILRNFIGEVPLIFHMFSNGFRIYLAIASADAIGENNMIYLELRHSPYAGTYLTESN